VPEDPEEVLPEQRRTARGRVVEVEAKLAVQFQQRRGQRQRREGEDDHEGRSQHAPDEQRQAVDRHAWRPQLEHGAEKVDRARRGRNAEENHAQRPVVDVRPRREAALGERHIVEPAAVGRRAGEKAAVHEQPGEQIDPVAERVEAREGHVARAEQERRQVVAEAADDDRRGEQKDHRRTVQCEELVVGMLVEEGILRLRQLDAQQQRLDAADHEEGK